MSLVILLLELLEVDLPIAFAWCACEGPGVTRSMKPSLSLAAPGRSPLPLPAQFVACGAGYAAHVALLSRRSISVAHLDLGLDTVAGLAVLAAVGARRLRRGAPPLPSWLYTEPRGTDDAADAAAAAAVLDLRRVTSREKLAVVSTLAIMLLAPLLFSLAGPAVDLVLYGLAALGVPLTRASMLGARLLLEQTALYALLLATLGARHAPFFRGERWVRGGFDRPWLLPTLGGYAISIALFNLVEPLNQALLPQLQYAREGMVAKLANPADGSLWTLLLGAITPCVSAPIFEELQSRAFTMQALTLALPLRYALAGSGLLFGAQHMQLGLVLPLWVTGWVWGAAYVWTGNLVVPILIHALWNARIFVGSALGL